MTMPDQKPGEHPMTNRDVAAERIELGGARAAINPKGEA